MNLYFELLKTPVFTVEDVNKYYDNMDSARSAIKRLMKEGMVAKIRNNMYTCISGETGAPVANRFQIASKITPTSYVSHHISDGNLQMIALKINVKRRSASRHICRAECTTIIL